VRLRLRLARECIQPESEDHIALFSELFERSNWFIGIYFLKPILFGSVAAA
jgi:hypothetical protein